MAEAYSMNLVILTGRIGHIGELKQGKEPRRIKMIVVSISTEEIFKGGKSRTTWHKINVYGNTAEVIANHFRIGDQVNVIGKLQYRQWKDDDGIDRKLTEIVANKIWLISRHKKEEQENNKEEEEF